MPGVRPVAVLLAGATLAAALTGCSSARTTAAPANRAPLPTATGLAPCHPSSARPTPVVLLHGTFATAGLNWQWMAPRLRAAGWCVYAPDYGFGGLAPLEWSARELDDYVPAVLRATGARKVSLVGHSQGGLLARYWVNELNGARYVQDLVGLAPPSHGTRIPEALRARGCEACPEMATGSAFLQRLDAAGDTVPGVAYTVVATRYDGAVVPYTSAFLRGPEVTNVVVQDLCPGDHVTHAGLAFDPVVLQIVEVALERAGPAPRHPRVRC